MNGAPRSSRGVLGPLGFLLVAILWLITVSGNVPSNNQAATPAVAPPEQIQDAITRAFGLPHEVLTTHPTSLPTTGTGA